jgi:SAM-dependent methyltransferase
MADRRAASQRVVHAVRWRARRLVRPLRRSPRAEAQKPRTRPAGVVVQFTEDAVAGWVAVPTGAAPVRVALLLNGLEVAATWATDPSPELNNWGEVRRFQFALRGIWDFCKKSSRVTVRVDGKSLPIVGHGMYRTPKRNGSRDIEVLREKLSSGYVFGQTGRLQLSKKLDTKWQATVMDLYHRVSAIVNEALGYDVFLMYGTALGAVREGGVIGHDMDFDAGYVSKLSDGRAAARELQQLAYVLIDRGFDVDTMRTALHIHDAVDRSIRIDLFHLYFDAEGRLSFPFGVAGVGDITRADWRGMKEIEFLGGRALVPANDEQFVEHTYGPSWRSPKPGFNWTRDRTKRATEGIMPAPWGAEADWANFYTHGAGFTAASPFAEALLGRDDLPAVVVDIGTGDGRDARAFAKSGRRVIAVDSCEIGVQTAREHAEPGQGDTLTFAVRDLADSAVMNAVIDDALALAPDEPVLYYLRFFLHAVTEDVQQTVVSACAGRARPGDMLAVEFRTNADRPLPKWRKARYRRYQDGPAFGAALTELGFALLKEEHGVGLSPFEGEDPELYRVIARRLA